MIYIVALGVVILLDSLCVRFIFPLLPTVKSRPTFTEAFMVSSVSAIVIGIILLEGGGGIVLLPLLQRIGLPQALAHTLVKSAYMTLAPFLSGLALIAWTRVMPSLGFGRFWPDAFLAGLMLDFIDHGIVVPWTFRIAEALHR